MCLLCVALSFLLAQVTVFISDLNDNPPVFQQTSYSVQVSEALPENSTILNVLATDADYGSNAEVVYTIESQQPALAGEWVRLP